MGLQVQAAGQVPAVVHGGEPEDQGQGDAQADADLGDPEVRAEHRDRGDQQGDGGIQAVAAEHGGHPAKNDVTQGAAADGGEGAQQDGWEPAQADRQGLVGARDCPEPDHRGVESGEQPGPGLFTDLDEESDRSTGEGDRQVGVVGQRDRRAVLQQHIPDHASAQAGDDADHQEPEQVQARRASHSTAQQRARADAGKVEVSRHCIDPGRNQRSRHCGCSGHRVSIVEASLSVVPTIRRV